MKDKQEYDSVRFKQRENRLIEVEIAKLNFNFQNPEKQKKKLCGEMNKSRAKSACKMVKVANNLSEEKKFLNMTSLNRPGTNQTFYEDKSLSEKPTRLTTSHKKYNLRPKTKSPNLEGQTRISFGLATPRKLKVRKRLPPPNFLITMRDKQNKIKIESYIELEDIFP